MEKNREITEWLNRLMDYAKEQRFSTRILDGIEDCIGMANDKKCSREELNAAVEELLESVEGKLQPPAEQRITKEGEISTEDVRAQITEMAKRCRRENEESLSGMEERKSIAVRKAYQQMQEITYCEAHIKELKNEEEYLAFFEKNKSAYEQDAFHVLTEYMEEVSNNYQHMMKHMKSMFRSIGAGGEGPGIKKFYEEYDTRKEAINGRLEREAKEADYGNSDIQEFGQKTGVKIKRFARKNRSGRRLACLLPILIIVLLFIGRGILGVFEESQTAQEQSEVSEFVKDTAKQAAQDYVKKTGASAAIKAAWSAIGQIFVVAGIWLVLILLVIIVAYAAYIRLMKKKYDKKLCAVCSEYLREELAQFTRTDALTTKMNDVLQELKEEYERCYLEILNGIFGETAYDSYQEREEVNRFSELKETWNTLRYM